MLNKGWDIDRRARGLDAPIPFVAPEEKAPKRDEYLKFSLRSDPADANSDTYDLQVQFLKQGTPELVLKFIRE